MPVLLVQVRSHATPPCWAERCLSFWICLVEMLFSTMVGVCLAFRVAPLTASFWHGCVPHGSCSWQQSLWAWEVCNNPRPLWVHTGRQTVCTSTVVGVSKMVPCFWQALGEPLYRVSTGNYEYRLILRCRQEARTRFAKMRKDVLEKIELLDQKHGECHCWVQQT